MFSHNKAISNDIIFGNLLNIIHPDNDVDLFNVIDEHLLGYSIHHVVWIS